MKHPLLPHLGLALIVATAFILTVPAFRTNAAGPAAVTVSAPELAAKLSALQDGSSYVRLKMDIKQAGGTGKTALQLQIKERRSRGSCDVVYQVLWPKERKGESVLLRKSAGRAASGSLFTPPATVHPLDAGQLKESLLGSDLSYEDVVENFFGWEHQTITGTEVVDGVSCQILESKPGKGEQSPYSKVRSWIDPVRTVPLRVEKFAASGQLARRIVTTRVVKEGKDRWVPATLVVRRPGQDSETEIEGSRDRRGVTYSDSDFTADGVKEITTPKSGAE